MKTIDQILADNLRRFRKRKALTQTELAEASDMSLDMVQKIEGQRSWPGRGTVKKLAKALEIKDATLFQPEGPPVTQSQASLAQAILDLQTEIDVLKNHPLWAAWKAAGHEKREMALEMLMGSDDFGRLKALPEYETMVSLQDPRTKE